MPPFPACGGLEDERFRPGQRVSVVRPGVASPGRDAVGYARIVSEETQGLREGDPRLGAPNGYGNHKCRCADCRAANAAAHVAYIKRKRKAGKVLGNHGSSLAYDTGCRCGTCRLAHNARSIEKGRRYRAKKRAARRD